MCYSPLDRFLTLLLQHNPCCSNSKLILHINQFCITIFTNSKANCFPFPPPQFHMGKIAPYVRIEYESSGEASGCNTSCDPGLGLPSPSPLLYLATSSPAQSLCSPTFPSPSLCAGRLCACCNLGHLAQPQPSPKAAAHSSHSC